jgi:hypothetical protein
MIACVLIVCALMLQGGVASQAIWSAYIICVPTARQSRALPRFCTLNQSLFLAESQLWPPGLGLPYLPAGVSLSA